MNELTLSHSQIQTYHKCKFKWKLQYVDGWKIKEDSAAANFGTTVHTLLQAWYDKPNSYDWNLSAKILLQGSGESMSEVARAIRLVERYISEFAQASDKDIKTIATEHHFNVEFKTLNGRLFSIQGYIDWIFERRGKVFIADHKTVSSRFWTKTALDLDSQLTTYAALLGLDNPFGISSVDGVVVNQLNRYPYKDFEKTSIDKLVVRETDWRSDVQKSNMIAELSYAADEMLEHLERNLPFNKALNRDCERCPFSEACSFSLKGVDIVPFLRASCEQKETKLSVVDNESE